MPECNNQSQYFFSGLFPQAIERGPSQANSASEEDEGASGSADQGLSESDNMEVRGGRFSKSAEERQKMLKQRKEELLQQARRFVHNWLKFSTEQEVVLSFFFIFRRHSIQK